MVKYKPEYHLGLDKNTDYVTKISTVGIKRSVSTQRKSITEIDCFLQYPYKCRDYIERIGRNNFSKQDIVCDHKHSVTLKQYKLVLQTCFEVLAELLIQGYTVKLPYRLGSMSIIKTPSKKTDLRFLQHYKIYFKWTKRKQAFVNQGLWRFRPLPKVYHQLMENIRKDSSLIYNFLNRKTNVYTNHRYIDASLNT